LLYTEGTLEVQDLQSRNGTLVNGETITATRRLNVGDRITIGEEVLTVLAEPPARGSGERTVDMGGPHRVAHTDRPPAAPQEETLVGDPKEGEY
jgi:pSer/pThr/pTyr-binding forkhead associated (FHA) protein